MSDNIITTLTSDDIKSLIPHRHPILLVDSAEIIDNTASGQCFLVARPYLFYGHFPGNPVLPGIYMVEAMAQLGAVLIVNSYPNLIGRPFSFSSIAKTKFRQVLTPVNEVILLTAKIIQSRITNRTATFRICGEVKTVDKLAAESEFTGTAVIS